MEQAVFNFAATVNKYLSDYILIFLLIGVGLFYSIKTGFVQIRCFGEGMKKTFGNIDLNGKKDKNSMSSFQALATAIAAQVGTLLQKVLSGILAYSLSARDILLPRKKHTQFLT